MQNNVKIEPILPECWSDDIRMDVLFAPFRLKSVNAENYESKLKFWKNMIMRYCEHKGSSSFSLPEVRSVFQRKNKLPYGLETVLDDFGKEIRLETDFLDDPENTWSGWAVNSFVKKPFQWSVQKFKNSTTVDHANQNYVHLDILQKQSKGLEQALEKLAGTVVPFQKIEQLEGVTLNQQGLHLCLVQLQSLKKVFIEYKFEDDQRKIHLVKIAEKHSPVTPITEVDRSIYALEQTEESLIKTINEIEEQITKHDNLARQNVREGKKVMAKSYLRKKHQCERNLEKRSTTLDNIQTILAQIHETRSNGAVMEAYTIGSQTLKSLISGSNLNADNIDEIVDNIKESLEIHDEVQQSVANVQLNDKNEETALEQELMELMAEDDAPNDEINDNSDVVKPKLNLTIENDLIKQTNDLDVVTSSLSTVDVGETYIVDK